jgi:pyruvate, water dikinase
MENKKYIRLLHEVGINDLELVGGKNASLGEMLQHLTPLGLNVPDGFVITVDAYRHFISSNELDKKIAERIAEIDYNDIVSLRRAGLQIRNTIRNARFPAELSNAIIGAYHTLSKQYDRRLLMLLSDQALQLKICRMQALQDSRKLTSMSGARPL